MPVYEYKALDNRGKQTKGSLDADSDRAARQKLRSQGIFVTEIHQAAGKIKKESRDISGYFKSDSVSTLDLSIATRQLSTLFTAGLPLVSALHALSDQTENQTLKRIVVAVRENVESGTSFAKSIAAFPKTFPKLYINMVASGEVSGSLDTVLVNLADYLEAQLELKRKITGALMYPILMLVICALVISALLVFVVPKIVEIFDKQGAVLPLPTQIVLAFSQSLTDYWYILILAIIFIIVGFKWYYKQPHGRARIDRFLLRAPLFGNIYTKICCARVLQTLGALLNGGVKLLEGLNIAKNIVGNVHVTAALESAQEGIREGRSLARELNKSGIFPPMVYHMVGVGEKSGELEQMLLRAGKAYETEVSNTLNSVTRLIEPLMMIGVGGVVLFIVVSVLMPMADLIDVVAK
jgi:general secretion pathway protein F